MLRKTSIESQQEQGRYSLLKLAILADTLISCYGLAPKHLSGGSPGGFNVNSPGYNPGYEWTRLATLKGLNFSKNTIFNPFRVAERVIVHPGFLCLSAVIRGYSYSTPSEFQSLPSSRSCYKKFSYSWLIAFILPFYALGLHAQTDSVLVTKNFKFNDGVYRSFSDWRNNSPNWSWDSLNVVSATNPNTFLTQVEYIRFADGRPMHLDSIWGLVISGIPYVRLPKGAVTKPLTSFAGLRVRGLIGYYNYEVVEEEMVEIQAYNPVTGVPFRKGKVKKQSKTLREFMIHFERGETQVFNRENLMSWIADDARLAEAVAALPEDDLEEKLFKALLIYVDRYPVYTQK